MAVYAPERKRGQVLVLSDPEFRMAPTFEELPAEHESEVRWLIERTPIRTVGGSLLRVQGLSCESRHAGASFLADVSPFPAGRIFEALEASRAADEERGYETRCLIDALMLRPHPAAAIWVRRRLDAWLEEGGAAVDWQDPEVYPSERCLFLTALVGACGSTWSPMFYQGGRERPAEVLALGRRLAARLLGRLPTLDLAGQADVTYAVVRTAAAAPEAIRARLSSDSDPDGFALGMLRVAKAHERVCAFDAAREARTTALRAARRPELVARLERDLEGSR